MSGPSDRLDLSGRWAGVFFYPDGAPDDFVPTSFLAILDEHGSHFTGQTTERDYWSPVGADLHAVLEGQRTGLSLAFTKIPDGGRVTIDLDADDDDDDIEYERKVMTISHQENCVGCEACSRICPKQCHSHAAAAG